MKSSLLILILLSLCLLSVNVSGITVSYIYDDSGRLIKVSYGDLRMISYEYDSAGNLIKRSVLGKTIKGDVFRDGTVDLKDAIVSLQIVSGISDVTSSYLGDIDGDGKIGLSEASFILKKLSSD